MSSTADSLPSMSNVLERGPLSTMLPVMAAKVLVPCASWSMVLNWRLSLAALMSSVLIWKTPSHLIVKLTCPFVKNLCV